MSNQVSWKEIAALLSPAGQAQLIALIHKAQEERGAGWLEAIQANYPMASFIIDLVVNHSAEDAYNELAATFTTYPLWIAKGPIMELHGRLLAEINKPRLNAQE